MNYKDITRGKVPEKWYAEDGFTIAYIKGKVESSNKHYVRFLSLLPGQEEKHLRSLDPNLKKVLVIYENISKDADDKLTKIQSVLESGEKIDPETALLDD